MSSHNDIAGASASDAAKNDSENGSSVSQAATTTPTAKAKGKAKAKSKTKLDSGFKACNDCGKVKPIGDFQPSQGICTKPCYLAVRNIRNTCKAEDCMHLFEDARKSPKEWRKIRSYYQRVAGIVLFQSWNFDVGNSFLRCDRMLFLWACSISLCYQTPCVHFLCP